MDYYPLESPEYRNFCSDYVPLPFAINTTQALGLKEIHLSDRFIMPHKEGYVYSLGPLVFVTVPLTIVDLSTVFWAWSRRSRPSR
jgi:hypothetical protein